MWNDHSPHLYNNLYPFQNNMFDKVTDISITSPRITGTQFRQYYDMQLKFAYVKLIASTNMTLRTCYAFFLTALTQPRWTAIECYLTIVRSSFICEEKLDINLPPTVLNRSL